MDTFTRIKLAFYILVGTPVIGIGETTSKEVARIASKGLRAPMSLTAREIRSVCASALTQAG